VDFKLLDLLLADFMLLDLPVADFKLLDFLVAFKLLDLLDVFLGGGSTYSRMGSPTFLILATLHGNLNLDASTILNIFAMLIDFEAEQNTNEAFIAFANLRA